MTAPPQSTQTILPSPSVVRYSHRVIRRDAPAVLPRALEILDAHARDPHRTDLLWSLAGLGLNLSIILQEAQSIAGRQVVDAIYALHQFLGHGDQPGRLSQAAQRRMAPYRDWTAQLLQHPEWRAMLMRWVDVFSERLTMGRYAEPLRRQLHAEALIAAPLRLVFNLNSLERAERLELIEFAEKLLRFWDLRHAAETSARGWNRLDTGQGRMGGYFGLAESPAAADAASIQATAQAFNHEINEAKPLPINPPLQDWSTELLDAMQAALAYYHQQSQWPPRLTSPKKQSILTRLQHWMKPSVL